MHDVLMCVGVYEALVTFDVVMHLSVEVCVPGWSMIRLIILAACRLCVVSILNLCDPFSDDRHL